MTQRTIAACLIGYPLPDEPEAVDEANTPAMFIPLQQLENLAPGTWYVNVLASYHNGATGAWGHYCLNMLNSLPLLRVLRKA